ncbi:putative bifunctional diguanylate cyclase/phosphodiesterase [Paenibacillus roseipurpureus]|uniref:EAL domain-containing protein n=1 Tax=Paenibacillus roseopurpureus TaxID=2918901 RepID=A0AA96RN00_9BACL|nr:EAL domain-containing protein [Paenibacillus sp. MBLB1832]WNR44857.1 EAL domain-containing protein [Paenibacillus sp. MBLB1832]
MILIVNVPISFSSLKKDLGRAIETDQLSLYYQPQIDMKHRYIVGIEGLVRWNHPNYGLIPPSSFIPMAEENGLIVQLGLWVMREGCRANHRFAARGLPPLFISINISPNQLNSPAFLEDLYRVIQETGVDPQFLELEITESMELERVDQVSRKLREVRNLGIRIAIDDFGAGLSNYHRMHQLPIDRLKLDRSLIRNIHTDDNQRFIVSAIILLANRRGIDVIAEGVEHAEQEKVLLELGCSVAQGFYYGQPMTCSQWEQYYSHHLGLNLFVI